jgi:hypothetical protein
MMVSGKKIIISPRGLSILVILNASIFLINSLLINVFELYRFRYFLLMLGIFGICSITIFIISVLRGYLLNPYYWFNLGAGIFFGLGVIPFLLRMYDQSSIVWYGGYGFDDVIKACLVNSISIFIVLTIAFFVANPDSDNKKNKLSLKNLLRFSNYLILFLLSFIIAKYYFYPTPENLIVRGSLDKLANFSVACILIGGIIFEKLNSVQKILLIFLVLCLSTIGILSGSKFDFMLPITVLSMGLLFGKVSIGRKLCCLTAICTLFIFGSLLTNSMKGHCMYSGQQNLKERLEILTYSVGTIVYGVSNCELLVRQKKTNPLFILERYIQENSSFSPEVSIGQTAKILRRFNTTSIATFLIDRYDKGIPGKTLDNLYIYFVPRIIWKDKPITTANAIELSDMYYPGQRSNSLGPTYSAELYWNFGWNGVVFGSLFIGAFLGILYRMAEGCRKGNFNDYLVISVPAILYAVWNENWVGSTYIGGAVAMMQILLIWYFLKLFVIRFLVSRLN